jgi:MtN3 and saliva related transmembrane protein
MEGTTIAVLGTAASVLSTVSLLPQVLRTWRTRSAGDISALWLTIALASMMLWMGYGALIGASAVVRANALTALQAGFILATKLMAPKLA